MTDESSHLRLPFRFCTPLFFFSSPWQIWTFVRIYNFLCTNLNASKSPDTNILVSHFRSTQIFQYRLDYKFDMRYSSWSQSNLLLQYITTGSMYIQLLLGYFKFLMQSSLTKYNNLTKVDFIFLLAFSVHCTIVWVKWCTM